MSVCADKETSPIGKERNVCARRRDFGGNDKGLRMTGLVKSHLEM
jgi:hypothetical protein